MSHRGRDRGREPRPDEPVRPDRADGKNYREYSKNPVKDFCSGDLDGVCLLSLSLCSGKRARWTLPHEQPCYELFLFD
jgi:hypothetical protein